MGPKILIIPHKVLYFRLMNNFRHDPGSLCYYRPTHNFAWA